MIPVHQTKFGAEGNCFAACVASLFHVALDEVPQPTREELQSPEAWAQYMERLESEFLMPRGFHLLCFPVQIESQGVRTEIVPPGYAILNARSPRTGGGHSVVCLNGNIVHDPHPEGDGVGEWHDWRVFVALDPAFNNRQKAPNSLSWSSGTTSSKADPQKAEQIRREIEETKRRAQRR